jgi:hypothetical protein
MAEEKKSRDEVVAEIIGHVAQITPGPWHWSGNVDFDDPSLSAWNENGRTSVARLVPVERTPSDWRIADLSEMPEDQRQDYIDEFLFDDAGVPRTDMRLAFAVDGTMRPARDMAIFEVCPAAVERADTRVYRADIVGLRNPDAAFIAAAPGYVLSLLEIIAQMQAERPAMSASELARLQA